MTKPDTIDLLKEYFDAHDSKAIVGIVESDPYIQLKQIRDDEDAEVFGMAALAYADIGNLELSLRLSEANVQYFFAHHEARPESFDFLEAMLVTHGNACREMKRPWTSYLFLRKVHKRMDLTLLPVVYKQFQACVDHLVPRINRWVVGGLLTWLVISFITRELFKWPHVAVNFLLLLVLLIAYLVLGIGGEKFKKIIRRCLDIAPLKANVEKNDDRLLI